VYGGIVVEMYLKFCTWEVMDNEIYKELCFFAYMYVCVDVVVHFAIDLVTIIHHKNYTCLEIVQFLHLCVFHT
jgi:hypothetical protein